MTFAKLLRICLAVLVSSFCVSASTAKSSAGDGINLKSLNEAKLESMLKSKPKDWKTHYIVGRYYEDQGINDLAIQSYQTSLDLICAQPRLAGSDPLKRDVFKRLAMLCLTEKDPNKAGATVKKSVELYPTDYGILLTAGYVEQNNMQVRRALSLYERAQKVDPKKADIYVALADCYIAMNDRDKARSNVEKALKLDPNSSVARYEKAKMLVNDKKLPEAIPLLRANFDKDPLNHDNTSLYSAALVLNKQENLSLLPLFCLMSFAKGNDLVKLKATAMSLFQKCSNPQIQNSIQQADGKIADKQIRGRMHFCLGDIFDRLKEPALAMAQYEKGLTMDPNFARGYLRLGEDYEMFKRDKKQAMKFYQKARSLDAKDNEINFRLKRLQGVKPNTNPNPNTKPNPNPNLNLKKDH